LRHCFCFV